MSVHPCPWCRCLPPLEPSPPRFDSAAPYAALVVEVDRIFLAETVSKTRATIARLAVAS